MQRYQMLLKLIREGRDAEEIRREMNLPTSKLRRILQGVRLRKELEFDAELSKVVIAHGTRRGVQAAARRLAEITADGNTETARKACLALLAEAHDAADDVRKTAVAESNAAFKAAAAAERKAVTEARKVAAEHPAEVVRRRPPRAEDFRPYIIPLPEYANMAKAEMGTGTADPGAPGPSQSPFPPEAPRVNAGPIAPQCAAAADIPPLDSGGCKKGAAPAEMDDVAEKAPRVNAGSIAPQPAHATKSPPFQWDDSDSMYVPDRFPFPPRRIRQKANY